jgi:TfoX/Sxy family transcriptional regulator of competence genes
LLMSTRTLIVLLGLLLTAAAQAQNVYRWTDERGEVHYGHAVPPEYADRGYDRLSDDGMVLERVERALTPQERATRAARRTLEAEAEALMRNQESRDRLLMAAYRSEDDINSTMQYTLANLDSQRRTIRANLDRSSQRFESQVSRAADYTRRGEEVPAQISQSITDVRDEMQRLRKALEELDQRELEIRQRFASELERFRELMGRS